MSGTRTHRDAGVRGTGPREFDRMLKAESPAAKNKKKKRQEKRLQYGLRASHRIASHCGAAPGIHATRILMQRGEPRRTQ